MIQLPRQPRHYLFEPWIWLFYCFFQPARFKNEFEIKGVLNFKRVIPMLRLLPTFLCLYLFLVLLRILVSNYFPALFPFSLEESAVFGLVIAIVGGFALGIVGNLTIGIVGGLVLQIVVATTVGIADGPIRADIFALSAGLLFGFVEGSGLSLTAFAIGGLALGMAEGIRASIAGCVTLSIAGGTVLFFVRQSRKLTGIFVGGIVGALVWFASEKIFMRGSPDEIASISSSIVFVFFYMLGYYRIPLYLISGPSSFKAYVASSKRPTQVFTYLNRSSLYWDECVFLPLPKLKEILLLAYGENNQKALDIIAFIIREKPQQAISAQAASLEIALRDLELRTTLDDIAQASPSLARFLSPDAELIEPKYIPFLSHLDDASKDATSFFNLSSRRSRQEALENMKTNLKKVSASHLSRDIDFTRLTQLTNRWLALCEDHLKQDEQGSEESGSIHNPYAPGTVLKPGDHLFVGRQDLALQLEEALEKGVYRPTFFLFGERRMGKSSTLRHLPNLLGSRHIPIFYDLQLSGILASTFTLLSRIAQEIYEEVSKRGIKIKKLDYTKLREASKESEAMIYYDFDEWLKELEHILKQKDRTLLLTFDEFESLEEVGQTNNLNITLLLNWFRSIIQHRPHIALLFSGVHTAADMKLDWAGYFVNVQALKVSFLSSEDAYKLIIQPTPDFPGERIFDKETANEIIKVTGRHPFLIQAVCSVLINHMNTHHHARIEKQDMAVAVGRVLREWGSYFQDLWKRTDDAQRLCLIVLIDVDGSTLYQIEQRSSLTQEMAYDALERLISRDLVVGEADSYHIAVPIFSTWIESNKRQISH